MTEKNDIFALMFRSKKNILLQRMICFYVGGICYHLATIHRLTPRGQTRLYIVNIQKTKGF